MTNDTKIRKLSADDVHEIRSLLKQKNNLLDYIKKELSSESIAKKFGISRHYVKDLGRNKNWAHLQE